MLNSECSDNSVVYKLIFRFPQKRFIKLPHTSPTIRKTPSPVPSPPHQSTKTPQRSVHFCSASLPSRTSPLPDTQTKVTPSPAQNYVQRRLNIKSPSTSASRSQGPDLSPVQPPIPSLLGSESIPSLLSSEPIPSLLGSEPIPSLLRPGATSSLLGAGSMLSQSSVQPKKTSVDQRFSAARSMQVFLLKNENLNINFINLIEFI